MLRLSSESLSRLIPEGGEPLSRNIDDTCPECGIFCKYAEGHFYTPPQSPVEHGFILATLEALNSPTASAPPTQSVNNADTPHYPLAPPSTPITTVHPDEPVQLWSSEVYKATINFPPSELPEHLRDSSWCHMPAYGEMAILFGPEPAVPFCWPPNTVQPGDDAVPNVPIGSKFIWGPLDVSTLPRKVGPPSADESQVHDKAEGTETARLHAIMANGFGSSVDSQEPVLHSTEAEAISFYHK